MFKNMLTAYFLLFGILVNSAEINFHEWNENNRKGSIGDYYIYENPYTNDTEIFELLRLGLDGKYWYFPKDKSSNYFWKYIGLSETEIEKREYQKSLFKKQIVHQWTKNDTNASIGNYYVYENPYNNDTEIFELINLGPDSKYWYFPKDKSSNYFWKYKGEYLPCMNQKYGKVYESNCTKYISYLDQQCEAGKIHDTSRNKCVNIENHKMPLVGCEYTNCSDYQKYKYKKYEYNSVEELYTLAGNLESNSIIMYSPGGPNSSLDSTELEDLHQKFLLVYVHQTNTLKSELLKSYDLSVVEAQNEIKENLEILNSVYSHLKSKYKNKKISYIGHSMGSFLVLEYLSKYSNNFHKVIHMGGRLKTDEAFLSLFLLGKDVIFAENTNGYKQHLDWDKANIVKHSKKTVNGTDFFVKQYTPTPDTKILSSYGRKNYMNLLRDKNLSNLYVLYSYKDEQLGGLSDKEIEFLNKKSAKIFNLGWSEETLGHGIMFDKVHLIDSILSE